MPAANPDNCKKLTNTVVNNLKPAVKPYEIRDALINGLILRVQPSGTKSYYITYRRANGKRTRFKIGNAAHLTPAQAREEAKARLGQAATGKDPQEYKKTARAESNKPTLSQFIDEKYEPYVLAHRKKGKADIKRLKTHFVDELGDKKLSDITPWIIEKYRTKRLKMVVPATVNRDLAILRAMLNRAVEWGDLTANPFAAIKPLKVDSQAVVRYLSKDEEKRIREALKARDKRIIQGRTSGNQWRKTRGYSLKSEIRGSYGDHLTPMVLLSLNTGMRRGEIFDLTWNDVNFSNRSIVLHGSKTKSGKTRHIPLNTEAFDVLKDWKTCCDTKAKTDAGLIFKSKNGSRFDNTKSSWHALLKVANIQNFRWHDMRHHFASRLVMASVDLNTVRELLGHSDIKMTLRYSHLAPEHKARAVELLAGER